MDIKILKPGDKVLVECTVQAVFANSKMVMVTTRDCTEGFDAYIDEIQRAKPLEQKPTTKNDLGKAEQETDYTWEDISSVMDAMEYRTNSLIENIKSEIMHFANAHCSGDDINIYDVIKVIDDCCETENSTTKNDLGVDAVSRQEVLDLIADYDLSMGQVVKGIHALPSVTSQELQSFEWCDTCKEYDQENHCCHRWTKVIRNTVEEMKQGYIEREVLDKLDEIITDALDKSTDQKESQTLRWVLDKISEVVEE